jgi:hypothetical protein
VSQSEIPRASTADAVRDNTPPSTSAGSSPVASDAAICARALSSEPRASSPFEPAAAGVDSDESSIDSGGARKSLARKERRI